MAELRGSQEIILVFLWKGLLLSSTGTYRDIKWFHGSDAISVPVMLLIVCKWSLNALVNTKPGAFAVLEV